MTNQERQKDYILKRLKDIKARITLTKTLETTAQSGWCHYSDELNFVTQELIELKNDIIKLKKEISRLKKEL